MNRIYSAFSGLTSWVTGSSSVPTSPDGSPAPVRSTAGDRCSGLQPDENTARQRPSAPTLAARPVRTCTTAGALLPSAAEVTQTLLEQDFHQPLQLGVALDLPASVLLAQVHGQDPCAYLEAVLRAACPLTTERLAQALASDMLAGFHMAEHIRDLARRGLLPEELDGDDRALMQMARQLRPLGDRCRTLGENLDLPSTQLAAIEQAALQRHTDHSLYRVVEEACRGQGRSRLQWLAVLARAQVSSRMVEKMADAWQVPLPTGADCWTDWCRMIAPDPAQLAQALVASHERNPQGGVPVSQVFALTRSQGHKAAFALTLDDATSDFWRFMVTQDPEQATLVSLLRHAASQPDGTVRWDRLQQLAQLESVHPQLAQQMPPAVPMPEVLSRRLRPSDLPRLVRGLVGPKDERREQRGKAAEQEAFEVAALLGIGTLYDLLLCDLGHKSPAERALAIWHHIYNRIPNLETGHLVELFRQWGRPDLVERLTGNRDSRMLPSRPLHSLLPRTLIFALLAQDLQARPDWVRAFMVEKQLYTTFCYEAPLGSPSHWRLLNALAIDSDLRDKCCALLDKT